MPLAIKCHLVAEVSIEQALTIRDREAGLENLTEHFVCSECKMPVRPHKASEDMAAHFEHQHRNPSCSLSHHLK